MADPFEAMHAPPEPIHPDPTFASRLRARLEHALELPKGVTVSNLTLDDESPDVAQAASRPLAAVTPYLAVAGAERALSWYADALGAAVRGEPYVMPDGSIGHAELEVAGGRLMLSEQHPAIGVVAPLPGEGVPVTIHLSVSDVDAVVERAVSAGASLERAPADYEYGRNGVFRDPFGHRWLVSSEPAAGYAHGASTGLRHGDIGYVSLWVPDVFRAAAFFAPLLHWRLAPASSPRGRQVEGPSVSYGLWGDQERSSLFLCFAVGDVHSAVERVRSAGGDATEPHREPYGAISECADDQGVRFAVFEPPGGVGSADQVARPARSTHGDLAYVTMEVVDSARTRAFYGAVLGWRFRPGHVEDGWQVEDVVPMVGISGGHELATTVPMYQVTDIEEAVSEIRALGGSASDPEVQPYGITSMCEDDQGTRFYLGQL